MENYTSNIIEFLWGLQPALPYVAHDCDFIIFKCKALFKQSSVRHNPSNVCADELSIDCGLLPWQSAVMLGQQTSYFYKGDKVHCSAGLHFPELWTALRFLFFMRTNGISDSVVKAESRGLDTDVYASQIYCLKLVLSTCS